MGLSRDGDAGRIAAAEQVCCAHEASRRVGQSPGRHADRKLGECRFGQCRLQRCRLMDGMHEFTTVVSRRDGDLIGADAQLTRQGEVMSQHVAQRHFHGIGDALQFIELVGRELPFVVARAARPGSSSRASSLRSTYCRRIRRISSLNCVPC